jgi:hypothetical protein
MVEEPDVNQGQRLVKSSAAHPPRTKDIKDSRDIKDEERFGRGSPTGEGGRG